MSSTGIVPTFKLSKRDISYHFQNWSLPGSQIYSLTMKPSNSKIWQKLIQTCKYFFAKNSVFVADRMHYEGTESYKVIVLRQNQKYITLTDPSIKLWITDEIIADNQISLIIPRIYNVEIKKFHLKGQNIFYSDLKFLSSNVENIILDYVVVKNKDDTNVPFEEIIKVLPKIKHFYYNNKSPFITSNTVNELLKIPHFSLMQKFILYNISETFDIEEFFIYLKENKHTGFNLFFSNSISESYKNRLETKIDEILKTRNHNYKVPKLDFSRLAYSKWSKLTPLYNKI